MPLSRTVGSDRQALGGWKRFLPKRLPGVRT